MWSAGGSAGRATDRNGWSASSRHVIASAERNGVATIVPTVTSTITENTSAESTPVERASSPTTSESSLVCASSSPASSAERAENPSHSATAVTTMGVATSTTSASTIPIPSACAEGISTNAPSTVKNRGVKKSVMGAICSRTSPLTGKLASANPARNAPVIRGRSNASASPMNPNSTRAQPGEGLPSEPPADDERGDHPPLEPHRQRHQHGRLRQPERHRQRPRGQPDEDRRQPDHEQVLQEQHPDHQPPVRLEQLAALLEQPDHDERRGGRHRQRDVRRPLEPEPEPERRKQPQPPEHDELRRPHPERRAPVPPHPPDVELRTRRE
jgi:hypothetical protein